MLSSSGALIKQVFVVLNPVAGLTDANTARKLISRTCEEQGWICHIHETKKEDNLEQLVREAIERNVDLVIAAGGDGTISGVVSGMINSQKPVGILPAGTGNLLARDLGIPLNLEDALVVLSGPNKMRVLDVMRINGDYHVLNVSIGISSRIMQDTGREEKRRFGMLAYIWHGIGSVLRSRLHRFEARIDGRDYRFLASEVMITNIGLPGVPVPFEDVEINSTDGRLDLFILRARNIRDYINVLVRFIFRRRRYGDQTLQYLEIKERAELRSPDRLAVQADGEKIGHTPVELELIPGALRILVPERADGNVRAKQRSS